MDASRPTLHSAVGGSSRHEATRPANVPASEMSPEACSEGVKVKTTPVQIVLIVLGTIAFLYFARPVVLPVVLALVAGVTLKPFIRWGCCCHIPPAISAAILLGLLTSAIGIGFFQLGRPALE